MWRDSYRLLARGGKSVSAIKAVWQGRTLSVAADLISNANKEGPYEHPAVIVAVSRSLGDGRFQRRVGFTSGGNGAAAQNS